MLFGRGMNVIQRHTQPIVLGGDIQFGAIGQLAATPWSLVYDNINDNVDCGTGASVMNLHAANMTVDAYWQAPATAAELSFFYAGMVSQYTAGVGGWTLQLRRLGTSPNYTITTRFIAWGGAAAVVASAAAVAVTYGAWYYLRGRRSGGNLYASTNAVEGVAAAIAGSTNSVAALTVGNYAALGLGALGKICYVHLFNNDQGALGAVPTSPLPIGANTAARYRFTDGAGLTLTDDGGNANHGTLNNVAWSATVPAGWTL